FDAIRFEILQAVVDELGKVRLVVSFRSMGGEAAARLGGDVNGLAPFFAEPRHQPLTAAHPINICSVNKVDPQVDGAVQSSERFFIVNLAPGRANGPPSKTDFRNF